MTGRTGRTGIYRSTSMNWFAALLRFSSVGSQRHVALGDEIQNRKDQSARFAWFNRKMSFYFTIVDLNQSDWSDCENRKHSECPRIAILFRRDWKIFLSRRFDQDSIVTPKVTVVAKLDVGKVEAEFERTCTLSPSLASIH